MKERNESRRIQKELKLTHMVEDPWNPKGVWEHRKVKKFKEVRSGEIDNSGI